MGGLFSFSLLDSVEFADAAGSLGAKTSVLGLVSESWNLLLALLDEGEGKGLDVRTNDAAADGSSLPLSFTLGPVSGGAGGEEQLNSVIAEDSLLHGKAVLVEAAVDPEDVSLELFSEGIGLNFLAHAFLEKDAAPVVIVDVEGLGSTVGRI